MMNRYFSTILVATLVTTGGSVNAGIPVIDATSIIQTTATALEAAAQTAKQIDEYRKQVEQYADQVKNTVAPAMYVWDQSQQIMTDLRAATDTLANHRQALGSIEAYMGQFRDVDYYRSSPCFQLGGCPKSAVEELRANGTLSARAVKESNDALLKQIDAQQDALVADGRTLERLQDQAEDADGRMKAIQAANQLASNQANQLLHIRALMVSQNNAAVTYQQATSNRDAQERASARMLRERPDFRRSPAVAW